MKRRERMRGKGSPAVHEINKADKFYHKLVSKAREPPLYHLSPFPMPGAVSMLAKKVGGGRSNYSACRPTVDPPAAQPN